MSLFLFTSHSRLFRQKKKEKKKKTESDQSVISFCGIYFPYINGCKVKTSGCNFIAEILTVS